MGWRGTNQRVRILRVIRLVAIALFSSKLLEVVD
jgi:hypothetical protein